MGRWEVGTLPPACTCATTAHALPHHHTPPVTQCACLSTYSSCHLPISVMISQAGSLSISLPPHATTLPHLLSLSLSWMVVEWMETDMLCDQAAGRKSFSSCLQADIESGTAYFSFIFTPARTFCLPATGSFFLPRTFSTVPLPLLRAHTHGIH